MMRVRLAVLFALSLLSVTAFAQGYRGHDFWICIPQNAMVEGSKALTASLYITSDSRAHGQIKYATDSIPLVFSVEAGASMSLDLDTALQIRTNAAIERKGIHITSDNDISVYVVSHRQASTDSYLAIPTEYLGREYKVAGYAPSNGLGTQMDVIATEDNTWVTIKKSAHALDSMPSGGTISLGLRKGETFQLQSSGKTADLTGTSVISDKPIAFVTGHTCAQIPSDVRYCDMLMEMEPPANDFGREFVVAKFAGKDYSVVRVIANADATDVDVDGKRVATLNNGGFYECDTLKYDATITTSKPALVAQYASSSEADSVHVGDPFLLFVTPSDRFERSITTATVEQGPFLHFLNLIVPREAVKTLRIDGRYVLPEGVSDLGRPAQWGDHFVDIPGVTTSHSVDAGVNYEHIRMLDGGRTVVLAEEITAGRHDVLCDQPIGVYAYGWGRGGADYDSYGHACGQKLDVARP